MKLKSMITRWLISDNELIKIVKTELGYSMQSDWFRDAVAGRFYEYAKIAVLEVNDGDIFIVPEDITDEQFDALQEMAKTVGIRAMISIDKDKVGLLRVVAYDD